MIELGKVPKGTVCRNTAAGPFFECPDGTVLGISGARLVNIEDAPYRKKEYEDFKNNKFSLTES